MSGTARLLLGERVAAALDVARAVRELRPTATRAAAAIAPGCAVHGGWARLVSEKRRRRPLACIVPSQICVGRPGRGAPGTVRSTATLGPRPTSGTTTTFSRCGHAAGDEDADGADTVDQPQPIGRPVSMTPAAAKPASSGAAGAGAEPELVVPRAGRRETFREPRSTGSRIAQNTLSS